MIGEITAIFTGLKSAFDFAQTVAKGAKNKTEKAIAEKQQAALGDLQAKMFAVQTHWHELENENRELRQRLDEREKWKAEADRWELTQIVDGVFVYKLKTPDQSQANLWACTNCFQRGKLSFFQRPSPNDFRRVCPGCCFEVCVIPSTRTRILPPQPEVKYIDPSID